MHIITFWKIVLKGIGLWLLFKGLYIIPDIIVVFTAQEFEQQEMVAFYQYFGVIVIYLFITFLFLFGDKWLIKTLNLDKQFSETHINIAWPAVSVLKVAVIIIAGITFIESFSYLCYQMFLFWQQKTFLKENKHSGWLIFYIVKSVLAYIAMTNSATIVKWISKEAEKSV